MTIKENALSARSSVALADDQLRILWLDGGILKSRRIPISSFLTSIYASPTFTGTVVLPSGQILTLPTIASFANAGHNHSNAAGGGSLASGITLTQPTIADFTNSPHDHADTDDGGVLVAAAIRGLHGYQIQCIAPAQALVDATTYYFGFNSIGFDTNQNINRVPILFGGTIRKIYAHFRCGVTGTTEASTMSFRLNNTTDTTISSAIVLDASSKLFSNTGLSIAVAAGDTFEIKLVTPTWVTNPTGSCAVSVFVEP